MRRAKCCESAVSRYSENRWEQMGAIVFESGREYLGGSDCTIFYIAALHRYDFIVYTESAPRNFV